MGLITAIFAVFYSFQVLTASNFVHSISNKRLQVFILTKDRGLTRCIRWSSFQEVFDLNVGRGKIGGRPNVNFDFAKIYLKFSDPISSQITNVQSA